MFLHMGSFSLLDAKPIHPEYMPTLKLHLLRIECTHLLASWWTDEQQRSKLLEWMKGHENVLKAHKDQIPLEIAKR